VAQRIKDANYSQLQPHLGIEQSYGSRCACMKHFIFRQSGL